MSPATHTQPQTPEDPAEGEPARRKGEIQPARLDDDAVTVVRRLQQSGHEAYLVGGCVRDLLCGLEPKDFDVATDAHPNRIKRLFRNARIIGRRFRLAHILFGPNHVVETSTFRGSPDPDHLARVEQPAPRSKRTADAEAAATTASPLKTSTEPRPRMPGDGTSRSTRCSTIRSPRRSWTG